MSLKLREIGDWAEVEGVDCAVQSKEEGEGGEESAGLHRRNRSPLCRLVWTEKYSMSGAMGTSSGLWVVVGRGVVEVTVRRWVGR